MLVQNVISRQSVVVDSCPSNVNFFENGIPHFAEPELERLYECLMSTLLRFRQHYPLESAITYVAYDSGRISSIFIFRIEGNSIKVFNEQIHISSAEIARFAAAAFRKYAKVRKIDFYAIDCDFNNLGMTTQVVGCLEDILAHLPPTTKEYSSQLGKNTAESIRRYERRLQRDHPSFEMMFVSKSDIKQEYIRAIVGFNRLRMLEKGQNCYHTEDSNAKLMELASRYGTVGIALIDGKPRGGVILMRIGSHYYLHTLSHHPDFNDYRLGRLCCYRGIEYAIDQGGKYMHFGWGRFEYKYHMLGRNKELFRLVVYRKSLDKVLDGREVVQRKLECWRREIKLWLSENPGLPTHANTNSSSELMRRCFLALRNFWRRGQKMIRSG